MSSRTIREVQQDFANNSGIRDEIFWDLLSENQAHILKNKIRQLIPDQKKQDKEKLDVKEKLKEVDKKKEVDKEKEKEKLNGKLNEEKKGLIADDPNNEDDDQSDDNVSRRIKEIRETLFNSVWAQRKYTNRNSLSAIIYICVTKADPDVAVSSRSFSIHPVFRTRRCVDDDDSSKCCMIFVDEVGRVYQNWESFVKNNVLPGNTMVAPHRGVYTFNGGIVKLETFTTPAGSGIQKALTVADTTSAVGGFLSAGISIAAICTAGIVAAPVVAGAAAVGLTCAGYSAVRSGASLVDRTQHEQSIGLGDRQARNSWLGVAGGVIGLGAVGATRALTTAAAAGREVSAVTELVVNGMNISSIVLNGSGLANGVLDMILKYQDDEEITLLDVVQLSASLVLFTHSVSNFRLASTIVNETQNTTIKNYRDNLSNRQRRMFDKMSRETIRIRGETRGKFDIIRNVNEIPSKQYLNDLYKVNKEMNKRNIRPSFAEGGRGVILNNDLHVDTGALRNNLQHNVGPDLAGQVRQPIPPAYEALSRNGGPRFHPTRMLFASGQTDAASANGGNLDSLTVATNAGNLLSLARIVLPNDIIIKLADFGEKFLENVQNGESLETLLTYMGDHFREDAFRFIMNLTRMFMESMLQEIRTALKMFISTEAVLYRIIDHCLKQYSDLSYKYLESKTGEILLAVERYFRSLNPNAYPELLKRCEHCKGYFAIVALD